ncbi:MAG: PAS domain S-box protein [Oscillochloris sp.]|nr:PAS domain S-box protein [Oscillochloris sp.]
MAQPSLPPAGCDPPRASFVGSDWKILAQIIHSLAAQPDADPAELCVHALVPLVAHAAAVVASEHPFRILAFVGDPDQPDALEQLLQAGPSVLQAPLVAQGRVLGSLRLLPHAVLTMDFITLLADLLAFSLVHQAIVAPAKIHAPPIPELVDYRVAFERIYRHTGIGIAFGGGWSIVAANQSFQDLIGYSEAELRQISVNELSPPEDIVREAELAQGLLDGSSQYYEIEKHYYHKDGHLVPVRLTGTAVPVSDGNTLLGLVLVEDLTARRQTEAALRDSESRYRMLIEQQTELVLCWTFGDGRRTFVNDAYCRFFQRSREDLLGKPIYDVVHPADLEQLQVGIATELPSGHIRVGINRVVRSDGTIAWCEWTSQVISRDPATPIEIQSVGRDITARRHAEEVRDWLVAILEASPALVSIVDLEGRLRYLNRTARLLHGVPFDVAPERLSANRFQPDWVLHLLRTQAIPITLRDGIWHGETAFLNAKGDALPYWQTMIALRDGEQRVTRLATIAYDLSEQKRAAANQLALERKMLEAQKLESLGVLAGGIAHDFNNILAAIVGHAELAMYSTPISPEVQQSLQEVIEHSHRAADLTRQILAYTGKGRVLISSINLGRLVREVATLLAAAALRHCRLEFDIAPDVPLVAGDPSQLRQVILNLLMNSADAVDEGGLVRVRIWMDHLDRAGLEQLLFGNDLSPGSYVGFEVYDEGAGIPPEVQERIFEPFFSTKFVGRGMGLAAVQGIVRSHDGALFVASVFGKGTRFQIWLPVEKQRA